MEWKEHSMSIYSPPEVKNMANTWVPQSNISNQSNQPNNRTNHTRGRNQTPRHIKRYVEGSGVTLNARAMKAVEKNA